MKTLLLLAYLLAGVQSLAQASFGLSSTLGIVLTKGTDSTPGDAATINAQCGFFTKDTTGTTFTLTNSFINSNSLVFITFGTNPGNAQTHSNWVTKSNGQCIIHFDQGPRLKFTSRFFNY